MNLLPAERLFRDIQLRHLLAGKYLSVLQDIFTINILATILGFNVFIQQSVDFFVTFPGLDCFVKSFVGVHGHFERVSLLSFAFVIDRPELLSLGACQIQRVGKIGDFLGLPLVVTVLLAFVLRPQAGKRGNQDCEYQ